VLALSVVPAVALGVVLTAILVVAFGPVGLLVGLAVTLVVGGWVLSWAAVDPTPVLLDALGARPADPVGEARLVNVMEGLVATGGVNPPTLHVLDVPSANALVIGIDDQNVHIVATSGLLDLLGRVELEAVLARAVTLIRQGGLPATTTAVRVLHGARGGATLLARPVVGVLRARLGQGVGPDDDVLADRGAVALTRYPPGLIAALSRLAASDTVVDRPLAGTARLWFVDPRPRPGDDRAAISDRIDALEML
jgi:Zn-dependent protease with chaperone function